MKQLIRNSPIIGPAARRIYSAVTRAPTLKSARTFQGSEVYWKSRYAAGGHSGAGSYGQLAEFKAEILNKFVSANRIKSIIEYGCGDGNQLSLARYPRYTGFDVSPDALAKCCKLFATDKTKSFRLMEEYQGETAQLTLSLDVIYHLIERVN